jgi:hypothetical protein
MKRIIGGAIVAGVVSSLDLFCLNKFIPACVNNSSFEINVRLTK